MICDCCKKEVDSLVGGVGKKICQSCYDWINNPFERRKGCGNRWYDINRGAFVLAYGGFTLFGVLIGILLGKYVF